MKAMATSAVVGLLIITAVLLVLFAFQYQLFSSTDLFLGQKECKDSVRINAKARLLGYEFASKINCPTVYETASTANEEKVKQRIAYHLYNCWDEFGKGELELFPPSDATFCGICSVLEFEGKQKVTGLIEYLALHHVPVQSGQATYLEFLQKTKSVDKVQEKILQAGVADSVNTEKPLGFVFVYTKDAKTTKEEAGIIGSVVGYGTGLAIIVLSGGAGIPVVLGGAAIAGTAGGGVGYWLGSDNSANWDARILAVPWDADALRNLGCTYLPISTKNIK